MGLAFRTGRRRGLNNEQTQFPHLLRLRLQTMARQSGLPTRVHPHTLRPSDASHLLQSSGKLRAVPELLGHASINAKQVYTQLDHPHLAKVYAALHPRA